jgi:D-threonate/D-erythronate kinase
MSGGELLTRSVETDAGLRLAMLADDITGACAAGVQFSRRGASTRVYFGNRPISAAAAEVSVVVTHSRNDGPEEASRKVRLACDQIAFSGAVLCYKKIDSTLKGNLGAELNGIQFRNPGRLILVCPSFPKMHRFLVNGWLRASSVKDLEPIDLPSLLASQGARNLACIAQPAEQGESSILMKQIQRAGVNGAQIIVIDGATESHLDAIALAAFQIIPQPLLVGSAGLACSWSKLLLEAASKGTRRAEGLASASMVPGNVDTAGPVVFCIGSKNSVTCQQTRHLSDTHGVSEFDSHGDDLSQVRTAVADGFHLIISLEAAAQNSQDLRRLLAAILETDKVRGLVCSGGDTALLACSSLGAEAIRLHHEILPGLPWGTLEGGPASGLPICTKAGGFGSLESLGQVADFFATKPPFRWRPQ